MANDISSEKIMEKLKEIKKTFIDNSNQPNHYLKTSDVRSRQNQKLKKYLPQSLGKATVENYDHHQDIKSQQSAIVTFRKCLEQKLQNLFNQQKNLLKRRYQSNQQGFGYAKQNNELYGNQIKEMQQKVFKRNSIINGGICKQDRKDSGNNNIRAMQQKIRELEQKFRVQKQVEQIKNNNSRIQVNERQQVRKQLGSLKQTLLDLKRSNIKLRNKLDKKQKKNKTHRTQYEIQLEKYRQKQKQYEKQIEQLKNEINDLKKQYNTKNKQNEVTRPNSSRKKGNTWVTQNKKKIDNQILLQLYSQIDQLKYKLNRQTKQKLNLQQKNIWLQQKLKNILNTK